MQGFFHTKMGLQGTPEKSLDSKERQGSGRSVKWGPFGGRCERMRKPYRMYSLTRTQSIQFSKCRQYKIDQTFHAPHWPIGSYWDKPESKRLLWGTDTKTEDLWWGIVDCRQMPSGICCRADTDSAPSAASCFSMSQHHLQTNNSSCAVLKVWAPPECVLTTNWMPDFFLTWRHMKTPHSMC